MYLEKIIFFTVSLCVKCKINKFLKRDNESTLAFPEIKKCFRKTNNVKWNFRNVNMKDLLKIYENKQPEIVFHWKDAETEAEGWTVINSLRGGAAGGGTRMREGLDMNEVVSLAKTMEVKFTVSGPAIGGAKSGINFNPHDPRKKRGFRTLVQSCGAFAKKLLRYRR